MMEIFRWKVNSDMDVESEPQVTVVKLGEGYEQRRAAGLNHRLEKYNVMLRVKREEARHVQDFLYRQGGVTAFGWTPPYHYRPIKVVCRKWSAKVGMLKVTFTATFEQVVA